MSSYRLPKKCYEMMILYDRNGQTNWVTNVKNLLFTTGFNHMWYEKYVETPSTFISTFTQRLKDVYQQKWLEIFFISTKCDYYASFKPYIYTEHYLSCVTIMKIE